MAPSFPLIPGQLPTAAVERALVDAARAGELSGPRCEAQTLAVLQRGLTTVGRIAEQLEGIQGVRTRDVIGAVVAFRDGARSRPEATLLEAIRADERLHAMLANPTLLTRSAGFPGLPRRRPRHPRLGSLAHHRQPLSLGPPPRKGSP